MRRTRFGTLLLVAGWACFPLAFVFHTLAPALLGVLLVALVVSAPRPSADVTVEREAPAHATALEPFEVITRASDPSGAPLSIEEVLPPGVRVVSSVMESRAGSSTKRMQVVADDPGMVAWTTVHVRSHDPWGIWEDGTTLRLFDATRVRPELSILAVGRRLGKGLDEDLQVQSSRGFDFEPEIELLREYQPGDRLRDIDWAHTAKLGELVSRQMRRKVSQPVIILIQADRRMRWRRRASKLATCVRTAVAVAAAAESGGLGVGLVAWSEKGLETQVRVAGGRKALLGAIARIGAMPEPLVRDEIPAPPEPAAPRTIAPEERAFLQATSAFAARTLNSSTPLEAAFAALARVAPQPSLVVAFLDAEETPGVAQLVLQRIQRHGHRGIVVAPASGAHHYALHEADEEVVAKLVAWHRNRLHSTDLARRLGSPYVVLGPEVTPQAIEEVIRSAVS